MAHCDVTLLGAGPYGLSAGAHLNAIRGLDVRAVGEPMEFWKSHMPAGMSLRSPSAASNLSDPAKGLTYDRFAAEHGEGPGCSIPITRYVQYGTWFQGRALPGLERKKISRIAREGVNFRVEAESGETWTSRRVVIAGGIGLFALRPETFERVDAALAPHCSDVTDLSRYKGKSIIILGGGQSALETAAIASESGAQVEVIMRADGVRWLGRRAEKLQSLGPVGSMLQRPAALLSKLLNSPLGVGPAGVSRVVAFPRSLRYMPRFVQDDLRNRALKAAASGSLIPRLKDVALTYGKGVESAAEESGKVRLRLSDGSERLADAVLLATGYKVDVARYPFLAPELLAQIAAHEGFPKLGRGLESISVPGLHFAGAAAGWSYGPLMWFVAGTEFSATELARRVAKDKR